MQTRTSPPSASARFVAPLLMALALVAGGFLAPPALAAEGSPADSAACAPQGEPIDLAFLLAAAPAAPPAEADPAELPSFDPEATEMASCTATARCASGTTVSCSGQSSCYARDRNCPNQRGYVRCDGSYTYCPPCSASSCWDLGWECGTLPGSGSCPGGSCQCVIVESGCGYCPC